MENDLKSRHPVSNSSIERLSISISSEDKTSLERIAKEKKVSVAWVIRDAIFRYLESIHETETEERTN